MTPLNLGRRLLAVIVATAALAACTGGDEAPEPPTGPTAPASTAPPSVDPGAVEFIPGEFEYSWRGVDIYFAMDGNGGTLEIDNASGGRIAAPALYAILGDGSRSDATIERASAIPEGERASFEVTFPEEVDETTVGLVVLLIGGNNWGALAPAQAGD